MSETYYDILQPYFWQQRLQLHFIDTDGMILSMETKNIIKDLKNLEDVFDFCNLHEKYEIFGNKIKKVRGILKIETPKKIWKDEFICLRSKAYSFKCKCDDEIKKKLKGICKSKSKHVNFAEFKKCLDREKYQEKCNNYILRSVNHEIYLQKVKKSTLFLFHEKRCFDSEIKSKLWN